MSDATDVSAQSMLPESARLGMRLAKEVAGGERLRFLATSP